MFMGFARETVAHVAKKQKNAGSIPPKQTKIKL
jgi:hypothetical protein